MQDENPDARDGAAEPTLSVGQWAKTIHAPVCLALNRTANRPGSQRVRWQPNAAVFQAPWPACALRTGTVRGPKTCRLQKKAVCSGQTGYKAANDISKSRVRTLEAKRSPAVDCFVAFAPGRDQSGRPAAVARETGATAAALILYDSTGPYGWIGGLHARMLANLLGHFQLDYNLVRLNRTTADRSNFRGRPFISETSSTTGFRPPFSKR